MIDLGNLCSEERLLADWLQGIAYGCLLWLRLLDGRQHYRRPQSELICDWRY